MPSKPWPVCRYHQAKGFQVILVASVVKLLTLGFTVVFSAVLLLCVRWGALHAECVLADTCDLAEVRPQWLHTLQVCHICPSPSAAAVYPSVWLLLTSPKLPRQAVCVRACVCVCLCE